MNNWLRIGLRLLGLVMLVAGLALVGTLFIAGPSQMADLAGVSCADKAQGLLLDERSCNVLDVIEFLPFAGILIISGAVLVLLMRRPKADDASPSRDASGSAGIFSRAVASLFARATQTHPSQRRS
jgi:hypothetical protein